MTGRVYHGVIFDLDGTLLDTERVGLEAGASVFESLGLTAPDSFLRSMIGKDHETCDAMIRAAYPEIDLEDMTRRWIADTQARYDRGITLKPFARDLLIALQDLALPLGLATSSRSQTAHAKLKQSGIDTFFGAVVTADDVDRRKPDPQPFLRAAHLLGVAPETCLAFEDSDPGAEAACAAGMTVVQVPDLGHVTGKHAHFSASTLLDGARMAGVIL